ncbi:MAG TPA: ABC transporter permease [Acetobacteraceae bacterium]|nr:ABC transporter permease [Acetobacteraceae bacterium]
MSSTRPAQHTGVAIEEVTGLRERTVLQSVFQSQPFWVAVALLILCLVMSWLQPEAFASADNVYNITRNFAFIGIMALGMTAVILTGGIDLSVGSIMGVVGVVSGLVLQAGYHWLLAIVAGLGAGLIAGGINGGLVAYAGLPSFVVTLGMLSVARSLAIVFSQNKMIYEFGPYGDTFNAIGGGQAVGLANPVWALIALLLLFSFLFNFTPWGRYLHAIGGNENAARLTGVPVNRIKCGAYVVSALTAAIAAIMLTGWQGSALNNMGIGWELRVIAATVIGGANLVGGEGSALGAVIGSALIEVIRNGLLMAGVDANWQGTFVGVFIVAAVLLQYLRGRRRAG